MPDTALTHEGGLKVIVHGTHFVEIADDSGRPLVCLTKSDSQGRWIPRIIPEDEADRIVAADAAAKEHWTPDSIATAADRLGKERS